MASNAGTVCPFSQFIADLGESEGVAGAHVAEALIYRGLRPPPSA